MTTTLIYLALEDLDKYSRDKSTLMQMYIEERLNKCLTQYQNEVIKSISNLSYNEYRKALKEELDTYE